MSNDTSITRGGKNVFADLGYADPETHLLKAGLVTHLREIISESKLTQVEAAERMGLSQPDVSRLLRGAIPRRVGRAHAYADEAGLRP